MASIPDVGLPQGASAQDVVNQLAALSAGADPSQLSGAALAQQADLQQKIANGIAGAAADMNKQMNEALSSMLSPIYDIVRQFKDVPPKIESIVDVEGAANGMYKQLGKIQQNMKQINSFIISVDVPITLQDYRANPSEYQNLLAIEYQKNEITEDDCLSSGYTKTVLSVNQEFIDAMQDLFTLPESRDIVGKQMEKLVGSVIKTAWQTVKPPVQTIASIANIGPIPDMIQSIMDSIDSIVKLASKTIPEKKLDEMLAQKLLAQEKAKAAAQNAGQGDGGAGDSEQSMLEKAMASAADTASQIYDGTKAGFQQAFADFEAPSLPDDVKETIEDFKDAIIMVKDNISNIYIVVLLKMLGAVFKCFNQILGVIGVPSIPDPLGRIPQLISDATSIMQFVMGLPASLVKCLVAIMKRKMKAIQIAMMPSPPMPLPEQHPVPPTSKDVPRPETTWDDVQAELTDKYGFSAADAGEVVKAVKAFYDGSGESAEVIVGQVEEPLDDPPGAYNSMANFETATRYQMTPLYCKDTWIPEHVRRYEDITNGGFAYTLAPPLKVSEAGYSGKFFYWADGEKVLYKYDDDWSMLMEYYGSDAPGDVKAVSSPAEEPGGADEAPQGDVPGDVLAVM